MKNLIFDLQRFAATVADGKVTIPAGDTYALDGVTYTAITDAQLNLDDEGKVSGIESGSVTATVTRRTNPTVTLDASDGAINFVATGSGSVLAVSRPFPMELIGGEFIYKGNTLTTSAGSRLAVVSQLGNYALRNESVYEFGSTFTFTSTALNVNSAHTTSVFTLTNGSDVRRLQLETFGPVVNNYSERGFRLLKGTSEAITIGGYTVTATAKDDTALNIELGANGLTLVPATGDGSLNVTLSRGDTEIISGELNVTSGSITFGYDNKVTFAKDTSWDFTWNGYTMTATTTDEATIGVSLTGNGISFTPGQNDGGLNLVLRRGTTPIFAGELNVTDGTITFDATTQKFSFTEGTNISLTLPSTPPRQVDFKVTGGDASVKVEAGTDGKFILTPDDNDGALQISVSREGQTVFQNTFSVSGGSIVFDPATNSVGLTKGTSVSLGLNNYTVTATATDDAGFGISLLSDGRIVLTPQENDGALNIAIRRGSTTIFQNTVSVSGGSITVNPETLAMTLSKGTNISLSFGNYELNATTTADATVGVAILESGIAITPTPGDGSLNLTLNSAGGSISANVEVVSGSFILGDGGLLTVAKDTELKIDFGDGYIVDFKATDDAGGALALGAGGITFAPNTQDGGLQLSITRDGQTRTASLDVTGSVTYSLDGSISLAKGTVVRNVFDSGNVLTITANTDASGSIVFSPQNGLTVTPTTPDALNIVLTTDGVDVVNISSIDGSINYNGGVVTASDGTKAHISYYFGWESELRTTGGTASIQFTADRTVYIANEGANFVIDYLDGTTTEIQNGTYSDIYATETSEAIELVSEGSIFKNNDAEVVFTLEKAGNYILNGMNIATTKDGVEVVLSNYDTVTFAADAGIVFDGQEFSGGGIITLTNGAILIENTDDAVRVNGTALNDSITNSGDNVTINALGGNDTINSSGNDAMIDGGDGNNLISLVGGSTGSNVVFDGNTTVEGFKTGWSNGADTLYINKGSDPGVDFKSDGLTFYDDNDSLTLDDVDDTAKINLYYEASDKIARNVYIARNDWYQVSNSDLTVDSGEGIYFVGTSATHNHGVDFSGVSQPLNVTMNTDYAATNNSIWVNNVYSIRGGAGNTTITGTDDSDTIIAGTGSTTIDGKGGNDRISLGSAQALVKYTPGDGNDLISGFNDNSTLSITSFNYSSVTSGNDVVLTVDDGKITLQGAASLDAVNIETATPTSLDIATSLVGAMLYRTEKGYPVIAGIALNPETYPPGGEPTNYASKETWTIESADGLELKGFQYTPEDSNDKWVVIVHGYGHNHKHMYPFAWFYLANGYNVLMVDERAAGESEGNWLTMGTAEASDIALWTQEIARHNSDAKITLFGVSMGAATAMLAAAHKDTTNVTSLIEDCGYSNVVEIINNFNQLIFKQDQATVDLMQPVSESLTGYNLKDAAPIDSISAVKVPTLFITGTNDSVVPVSMLPALYDASGAEVKEKFIVEGATHGMAGLFDPVGYSNTVFRFVAEADGEGWKTENVIDGISLRGTSYNDTITNSGTSVTIEALGGDDYIANVVDSSVTTASLGNLIDAGAGNDTIYNYHTYNPTLLGGAGNDSIVVSNGHLTYVDGGDGNDTIGGELPGLHSDDWHMGGRATILGGNGDDYIDPGYTDNSSIDGGAGNDTIINNGQSATVNGGDGNNLIRLTTVEAGPTSQFIMFNGKTTVEGFGTGFGDKADVIYIAGDPAAVDFKSGGLTFYGEKDSLILSDVTTTAKVKIYHERRDVMNNGVFIADNDWYSVESGDLSVKSGEELYFVGPSANPNHGVDFSGISGNLNLTLDTAYVDSEKYVPGTSTWINGVYSIRGGAGNTTITGSDKSDTIVSGSGKTTINAGAGGDVITGNGKTVVNLDDGATATINGTAGDTIKVSDEEDVVFVSGGSVEYVNGKRKNISGNAIIQSGEDYLFSSDIDRSSLVILNGDAATLSGDKQTIATGKSGGTVSGYDFNKATFLIDDASAEAFIENLNGTDEYTLDPGRFEINGKAQVSLAGYDADNGTFVKFKTADGEENLFGWSPEHGGLVDGNAINKPQIIIGAAPYGDSTVRGGSKNDSIYAGSGDIVSMSGGEDKLFLMHERSSGATIDMGDGSESSRTTIVEGLDLTRDKVQVDSRDDVEVKVVNGAVQLVNGKTKLIFDEFEDIDDAAGLKLTTDDGNYTLTANDDSGIADADYLWRDASGRLFKENSTLYVETAGGKREYSITEGSGRAVLDDFTFGTNGDKINMNSTGALKVWGNDLLITNGDGDRVTISGGANKIINVNVDGTDYVGELGKELTYSDAVEYYGDLQGHTGSAISVGADYAGEEVAVYMNGAPETNGRRKNYLGVNKIDASAFDGRASLIGGELDDKIIAAQGATSLWGGNGGDDTLIGTGADNEFFYFKGNGRDVVQDAADGDVVNFYNVQLSDIISTEINSARVEINFTDGGKLTMNNGADVTFKLGDGSAWRADRESRAWK